jgi:hypothetical protein
MRQKITLLLLAGLFSLTAFAQTDYVIVEDLTSRLLQNADFSADEAVTVDIRTYSKDMADYGAGSDSIGSVGLYGQQPVTGWIAANPTDNIKMPDSIRAIDGRDARAGGIFALIDDAQEDVEWPQLGGGSTAYVAPYQEAGVPEKVLGMIAVWGNSIRYYQEATLPKGAYMMVVTSQNTSGGTDISQNLMGFLANDGTQYYSSRQSYPLTQGEPNQWMNDTIIIRLTDDTAGRISIGFAASGGSGSTPHLFIRQVKFYSIDENTIIQQEIAAAKEELLGLIHIGEIYNVDTSASLKVYNNPNATLEEIRTAIESQKKINESGLTDLSEYFIVNPHFSLNDTVVGGICTYDYDCEKNGIATTNYSMLPLEGWTRQKTDNGAASGVFGIGTNAFLGGTTFLPPTTMSDGSSEGKVLGFVTCWSMAVQYTQPVSLPAGRYSLSISYYNSGGTTAIDKNLIGFITDDGIEYLFQQKTFKVGQWMKESIDFELEEETTGYFSLGYKSVNTGSNNMPHFFVDGIFLTYVGTGIDPSLFALKSSVNSADRLLMNEFQTELKEQFQALVDRAKELCDAAESDPEANKEMTAQLNEMIPVVTANIEAYDRLLTYYEGDFADLLSKYETEFPSLYDRLNDLGDQMFEAVSDYTWTTAEIDAAIASVNDIIVDETRKAWNEMVVKGEQLEENFDISILIPQLAYTYSTSAVSNTAVPDKEWYYGSATNFKTQYGTAEVWNQSPFTVSRTLKDMPAGTYTIRTKAFYRYAENSINYSAYTSESEIPQAYLFAGYSKTPLANVAQLATTESDRYVNPAVVDEAEGLCVPNNQESAMMAFTDDALTPVLERTVQTVLPDSADLVFGITSELMEGNCWVVWYSFQIEYNAIDKNVLATELDGMIAQLDNLLDNYDGILLDVVKAEGTSVSNAAKQVSRDDVEAMSKAAADVLAATQATSDNIDLMTQFEEASAAFDLEVETNAENMTAENLALCQDILDRKDNPYSLTPEAISQLLDDMDLALARMYNPEYKGASDDNPVDFTVRIKNNSFETGTAEGWIYNIAATGDTGVKDNSNATYTIENADGAYVFNTWHSSLPTGGFWVAQTVKGLPAGTYQLDALMASNAGNTITLAAANASVDFVLENDLNLATDGSIIFTIAENEPVEIKASSQTWFKVDNFRLTYFGTESQKDPSAIDEIAVESHISSAIYNLSGQRIQTLRKGINIIDGKKVLVK